MPGFLKDFLQKIRNQPEGTRKIILWVTVISFSLVLFFFWIKNFREKIKNLDMNHLPKPEIELPNFEMPNMETLNINESE